MQCNIDARGKSIRFTSGLVCLVIGLVLMLLGIWGVGPFWALAGPGLILLAGGGFQLFEAHSGWCALRAMGIKSRH